MQVSGLPEVTPLTCAQLTPGPASWAPILSPLQAQFWGGVPQGTACSGQQPVCVCPEALRAQRCGRPL